MMRIKKGVIQTVVVGIIYGVIVEILLILFGRIFSMLFISSKYSAVLDASQNILPIWDICIGFCQFSMYAARQLRGLAIPVLQYSLVSLK